MDDKDEFIEVDGFLEERELDEVAIIKIVIRQMKDEFKQWFKESLEEYFKDKEEIDDICS